MRCELDATSLRPPVWPPGVRVRTYMSADARAVHDLLVLSYPPVEPVAAFEPWRARMEGDPEFAGELWFLAEAERELVGVALCWTSAFVKDLVVRPAWRRRGLADALLCHAFAAFAARGAAAVELKTDSTNAAAIALYERAGMRVVERLPPV